MNLTAPRQRVLRILVPSLVLAGLALLASFISTASRTAEYEIEQLATANSDSTQWSLAQSEVELLTLVTALYQATTTAPPQPEQLAQVRRRFDIFYSRIVTVNDSPAFDDLRGSPVASGALAEAQAFLARTAPLVDGDDATFIAALPQIMAEALALRTGLRGAALEGVRIFAQRSDLNREELGKALTELAVLMFLLFAALLATVAVLAILFRKSRRQALRLSAAHSHMRAVLGTSIDAIIVAGPDGRIRDFNEVACRMWNCSAQQARGSLLADLVVPEERQRDLDALIARMHEKPVRIELMQSLARRRTGELFPVEASLTSAAGQDGPVLVVFVRDISRRLNEQAELVKARDVAVAGERAKEKMLAIMSHEMRTPLNGVLGTLDLLKSTPLDPDQRRYVEVMERSGRLLLTHVNDVLDISRADAGRMSLASEMFDPGHVAAEVVGALEAEAARRGIDLSLSVIGARPALPIGDPGRVGQILMNLVGNALKFTQAGSVKVEVDRSLGTGSLEFRVIDTGIGIAAPDLSRIFDEFVTLDSAYNRAAGGSGLGLGIVRRLVALMGGDLAVESVPGTGSLFRVRLHLPEGRPDAGPAPLHGTLPALASEAPATGPELLRPLDVLVVEDNGTNRMIVREMLRRRGCEVTEAADGTEGVELAEMRRFDLIFMDISMPRLDGLGATRLIREGRLNADTPIVALTAHAMPEELASFKAAGMDAALTKPLTAQHLDALLESHVDAVRQGPCEPQPDPEPEDTRPHTSDHGLEAARMALIETLGPEQAEAVLHRLLVDLATGLARLADLADEPGQLEEMAGLSHRLAGSAAVAGLSHMHRLLVEMEAELRIAQPGRELTDRLHRHIAALGTLLPEPAPVQPSQPE